MLVLFRNPLLVASAALALWVSHFSAFVIARGDSIASLLTVITQQQTPEKKDQEPDPAEETDDEPEKSADKKKDETPSADPEDVKKESKKVAEKSHTKGTKEEDDSKSKSVENSDKKEEKKKADDAEKKKSKPFTVESKPLKIEQSLEGIFVASDMDEVALRPDVWARYTVVDAVEHGKEVKKGDILIRFDDGDIEERLAEETIDQRLSELALMQAEEESPRTEKLLKIAYDTAKRTYDQLVEDHKYYLDTDRPFAERIAKYRFDSAKEDLASQEEELTQLKKMYDADEITEETEEIVLRRQEFEVQTAKLMFELQTANRDYTLQVSLPRNDLFYVTSLADAKLALEQAKAAMELGTTRGKYDLEKKRAARTRSMQSNAKLLADRALMELKAPSDGTVYYGRCVSGQWAEIGSMTAKLVPFSMVPPNTVLMTVVKQRPLYVLTSVNEKDLIDFKNGLPAKLIPSADDKAELSAKVSNLSGVPGGGKKFDMRLDLDASDLPEWLVAGMSCAVKVTTYDKKDVLLVPSDLINTDKDDEETKYVMLLRDDDKEPIRREVKLGKTKEKMVEVLTGLKEGDKIVKEEPKKDDETKD